MVWIFEQLRFAFKDKNPLTVLWRISIVMKQNWLLNWTVHSIMKKPELHGTKNEALFLKVWTQSNSVFLFGG